MILKAAISSDIYFVVQKEQVLIIISINIGVNAVCGLGRRGSICCLTKGNTILLATLVVHILFAVIVNHLNTLEVNGGNCVLGRETIEINMEVTTNMNVRQDAINGVFIQCRIGAKVLIYTKNICDRGILFEESLVAIIVF